MILVEMRIFLRILGISEHSEQKMNHLIPSAPQVYERTIGERLKHYRLEQNITQAELASRAGIARRTITSVEQGKGCTLNTLIRILQVLNQMDLIEQLLATPPLNPHEIHRLNMLQDTPRKYASKPRKPISPKPFVWGDEKPNIKYS